MHPPDPGSHLLDPSRALMPEDERRGQTPGRVALELLEDSHVAVARARTGDFEKHLARAGDRPIHLVQRWKGPELGEHDGSHGS